MMKNIGLDRYMNKDVDNFTSDVGIKLRRAFNPALRVILKKAVRGNLIIENSPKLEKGVPYIFASSHYFSDDVVAALAAIDRNAYFLLGTTNQLENNPLMYAAWVNGFVYINRLF